MRAVYGPTWGAVIATLPLRHVPAPLRALTVASAIWLFELVALPLSGATPPLRQWPRGEAAFDATNALVYSAVTCAVLTRAPIRCASAQPRLST